MIWTPGVWKWIVINYGRETLKTCWISYLGLSECGCFSVLIFLIMRNFLDVLRLIENGIRHLIRNLISCLIAKWLDNDVKCSRRQFCQIWCQGFNDSLVTKPNIHEMILIPSLFIYPYWLSHTPKFSLTSINKAIILWLSSPLWGPSGVWFL